MTSENIEKELRLCNAQLICYFRENDKNKISNKASKTVFKILPDKLSSRHSNFLEEAFVQSLTFCLDPERNIPEEWIDREALTEAFHRLDRLSESKSGTGVLNEFSKEAEKHSVRTLSLSALEGAGLGFIGIGSPEAVLLCGLMLRAIYETALVYGINIDHPWEKELALIILSSSFSAGQEAVSDKKEILSVLHGLEEGRTPEINRMKRISTAAKRMSESMSLQKLIQGIPIVGLSASVLNPAAMGRVMELANLVYKQRYLAGKLREKGKLIERKEKINWNSFEK